MEAARAEGFQYYDDMNAKFEDGYFPITISNIDDKRVSANVAYLTMEVRAKKKFELFLIGQRFSVLTLKAPG